MLLPLVRALACASVLKLLLPLLVPTLPRRPLAVIMAAPALAIAACVASTSNGRRPVSMTYSVTPALHKSARTPS